MTQTTTSCVTCVKLAGLAGVGIGRIAGPTTTHHRLPRPERILPLVRQLTDRPGKRSKRPSQPDPRLFSPILLSLPSQLEDSEYCSSRVHLHVLQSTMPVGLMQAGRRQDPGHHASANSDPWRCTVRKDSTDHGWLVGIEEA